MKRGCVGLFSHKTENIMLFDWLFNKKEKPRKSAKVAKDRLKLILSHERSSIESPFLEDIKEDIIRVLSKYIQFDPNDVNVNLQKTDNRETLAVSIPVVNR